MVEFTRASPRNQATSMTEITDTAAPALWSTAWTGRQVISRRTRPPTEVAKTCPSTASTSTAHSEMVETTSEVFEVKRCITTGTSHNPSSSPPTKPTNDSTPTTKP